MSKGSTPRARQVSREDYERRWERAFGAGEAGEYHGWRPIHEDIPHRFCTRAELEAIWRAEPQADGDPGDDYAVERAGA